jgi:hypothetical protein
MVVICAGSNTSTHLTHDPHRRRLRNPRDAPLVRDCARHTLRPRFTLAPRIRSESCPLNDVVTSNLTRHAHRHSLTCTRGGRREHPTRGAGRLETFECFQPAEVELGLARQKHELTTITRPIPVLAARRGISSQSCMIQRAESRPECGVHVKHPKVTCPTCPAWSITCHIYGPGRRRVHCPVATV